jgi:pimeloyl-ACP methyl ester carboxylesterase
MTTGRAAWDWISPEFGQQARPSLVMEQRAGMEFAELLASPVYYGIGVPRGDGRDVLLLPGFMGSDGSMTVLSNWLRRVGYRPAQSGIPWNVGSLSRLLNQVEARCEELAARSGRISIIGHSLGGIFGRVTAVRRPDLVEEVIALGAPLVGNPRDAAHPLVRALSNLLIVENPQREAHALAELAQTLPPTVRLTSIYSREDAIVDFRTCIDSDPRAACFEVRGSHMGLPWNAAVYRLLARELSAVSG